MEKQTSERANVLVGIINQSENIINNLGDCSTKPSLKRSDIQRKMFDLLFYTDEGIPKSKEELTELKKQYVRNVEWCKTELEKYNP